MWTEGNDERGAMHDELASSVGRSGNGRFEISDARRTPMGLPLEHQKRGNWGIRDFRGHNFLQNKPTKLLKRQGRCPESDKTIPISDTFRFGDFVQVAIWGTKHQERLFLSFHGRTSGPVPALSRIRIVDRQRRVRIVTGRELLALWLAGAALGPAAFPGPEARFLGADEAGGGNQQTTRPGRSGTNRMSCTPMLRPSPSACSSE